MPEFKERHEARERAKHEELAPCIERALARKEYLRPLRDDEIPEIHALGRQIVEQAKELTHEERERIRRFSAASRVPLEDPAG